MRSRRTTLLLLFLAFVFILTIIILCLSPGKSEQLNKERIMAHPDIGYTNDVTKSTSSYSSTTVDNESGWITKSTTRPTTTPKTSTTTSEEYSPTTTTKTPSTRAIKDSVETSTSYETTASQRQKYLIKSTTQSTTTETPKTTEKYVVSTDITTPTTSTATETTNSKTSSTKAITTPTESSQTTTEISATTSKTPTFTSTTQATSTETPTTTKTSTTTEAPTTTEASTTIEAPTTTTSTETSNASAETSTTITETPTKITQETSSTTTVTSTTTTETPITTTDIQTTEASPTTAEIPTTTTEIPTTTTEIPTTTTQLKITTTETITKPAFTTSVSTTKFITTETFTTSQPLTTTTTKLTTTTTPPKILEPFIVETGICDTTDCKTIASKMLDSIDHSAHYCEDFYQYSCGGVEDDPFLSPEDPKSVFDAILKGELSKTDKSDVSTFYESCKNSINSTEKIQEFLLQISKIDSNISEEVKKPFLSLTSVELLSLFMKQNLPLFFDVSVEPCHNKQYCLRLSLSFSMTTKIEENYCLKMFTSKIKSLRSSEKIIDLNEEYKNYHKCLSKSAVKIRIANLKKILDKLDVSFLHLTDETDEILDDLDGFLTEYNAMIYKFDPSKVKKEVMDEENFELITIENLEKDPQLNEFIKWRTFLENLELNLNPHQQVRVYHKDKLLMMLELLKDLETRDVLKDFLLILWIEHLNINLETSEDANTDNCLEKTKQLMPLHVQILFLQHLNSSALGRIKAQVREIGVAAIEEVKGSVSAPPMEEVTVELENSAVPYLESQIVNTYNETNLALYEYHVTNIINLNEKFRKNNYELIMTRTAVEARDNIFLLKYQDSHYQLMNNVLLIPATAIVDSAFLFDQAVPNYLKLLGVTNVIVNALLKQFNISEPYGTGNDSSSVCLKREASGSHQRKNQFGVETTFKIDDRRIQREFDVITINWKILQQFGSSGEKNESSLIWFDANPLSPARSYFIRKTQMECSEPSDVQLLQTVGDSRLPSRERVNLLLKYEPFFAQVFNCSQASEMRQQNVSCSIPEESTEFPPLISSTVDDYDYMGGSVEGN